METSENRLPPGARAVFAHPLGLIIVAVLGAAAAFKGLSSLTGLCAVLFSAGLMARLWGRLALGKLAFTVSLDPPRAFADEKIQATLILANNKFLPLSWVEASYRIPAVLEPETGQAKENISSPWVWLKVRTSLLWFQWARYPHTLHCRARGAFQLGPAVICTGDIFGLLLRERENKEIAELIVYPRIYELSQLGLPARFPLGVTRAADRLFEDPARSVGLREYVPGTALKHIHWKASARQQRLQVKVFEPTTTLQVAIFIDVESFVSPEDEADFEYAVSVAASIAWHISGQSQPIGVFANGRQTGREGGVCVRPRTGRAHLARLLESLARLNREPTGPLPEFLGPWSKEIMSGDTLVFLAADVSQELARRLDLLTNQGFKVWLMKVRGKVELQPLGSVWRASGGAEISASG